MKNHFPADYCPQREKVVDLSRSALSGRRRYSRGRRIAGRYVAKVDRKESREQLARAKGWSCTCFGDPDVDCRRCYSDDMPTIRETHAGIGTSHFSSGPFPFGFPGLYQSRADSTVGLYRWFNDRTAHLDHFGKEEFLREKFLVSPFGHSLQTRHAFDHLFDEIRRYRKKNYSCGRPLHKFFGGDDCHRLYCGALWCVSRQVDLPGGIRADNGDAPTCHT